MSAAPLPEGIDALVQREILAYLGEHGRSIAALSSRAALVDELGLSSSALAQIIARIDSRLHVEDLGRVTGLTDVRTVGDLCQAYRRATAGGAPSQHERDELERSRRRAEARRGGSRG